MQPLYDLDAVRPMSLELENIGIVSLKTSDDVDNALKNKPGTAIIVVNSVCGCAAGHARPGVGLALQNNLIPDHLFTVFAGVDREATQRAREYMSDVPPSSPSVALFKDGQLVFMLHRRQIEMMDAEDVAGILIEAFNEYCTAAGPSVPLEKFQDNFTPPQCSSRLPKYQG